MLGVAQNLLSGQTEASEILYSPPVVSLVSSVEDADDGSLSGSGGKITRASGKSGLPPVWEIDISEISFFGDREWMN